MHHHRTKLNFVPRVTRKKISSQSTKYIKTHLYGYGGEDVGGVYGQVADEHLVEDGPQLLGHAAEGGGRHVADGAQQAEGEEDVEAEDVAHGGGRQLALQGGPGGARAGGAVVVVEDLVLNLRLFGRVFRGRGGGGGGGELPEGSEHGGGVGRREHGGQVLLEGGRDVVGARFARVMGPAVTTT